MTKSLKEGPCLSPMSRPCCLHRSCLPSNAGFFWLAHLNRAGPSGYCAQFWAIDAVETAHKAVAAAIDLTIAPIFIWYPSGWSWWRPGGDFPK